MKSLAIRFDRNGAVLDFDREVEGFHATAQAALVNMGTNRGTDFVHPERGTLLLKEAVSGRLVSEQASQHAVNFAAVDTLFFVRANEPVDSGEKLVEIITEPVVQSTTHLTLRLQMRGSEGTVLGTISDLPAHA